MLSISSKIVSPRALALVGALGAGLVVGALSPAMAADDGAAPLWVGIGSTLGLSPGSILGLSTEQTEPPIEYRERGRLVLPPKMELPKPVAPSAKAVWPVDPDVEKVRKAREAAHDYSFESPRAKKFKQIDPTATSAVTVRASAGMGPPSHDCAKTPGAADCRPSSTGIFQALGLQSKSETALGPEPDRDWLTDPPRGYRAPAEALGPATTPPKQ